jgi:hypothetical protein
MKRLVIIAVCLMTAVMARSQEGLHVGRVFDNPAARVEAVHLTGTRLADYNMTLYRSFSISDNEAFASEMERAVKADGERAVGKETAYVGSKLYYAFFALPPTGKGLNRYIFFKNESVAKKGRNVATLIYIEGTASAKQLEKMFKK